MYYLCDFIVTWNLKHYMDYTVLNMQMLIKCTEFCRRCYFLHVCL